MNLNLKKRLEQARQLLELRAFRVVQNVLFLTVRLIMSEIYIAKRAVIHLGNSPIEVFQLPSGQYQLSQTSSTAAVDKPSGSISDFKRSNSPLALPYKSKSFQTAHVEGESANIKLVPIDYAIAYWIKEAVQGNTQAILLLAAAAAESVECRADAAFCVERSESERNQRSEQVQSQPVSSAELLSIGLLQLQLQLQQMMLLRATVALATNSGTGTASNHPAFQLHLD